VTHGDQIAKACIRGCTTLDHRPGCTCTNECPDHHGHCEGCQPREAKLGKLCQRCATRVRDDLNAIPELTVHAASRTDGRLSPAHQESDTTRHATNPNPPSPSPAWDTAEETLQWTLRTALACADANHHYGPFQYRVDGVPDARNITALTNYIRAWLDWYATVMPEDIYDETTALRRRLTHATGRDRLTHRLKERCPSCNQLTLTRDDGDDRVECRNQDCGRIWREGEYEHLAHVAAS